MQMVKRGLVVAIAVGGFLGITAPPAGASTEVATFCEGNLVVRCAQFHYDSANQRVRAYGSVFDPDGSTDYKVSVDLVATCSNQAGTTCTDTQDIDAWGEVYDTGYDTALWNCGPGPINWVFTAKVHVSWQNKSTGGFQTDTVQTSYLC